MTTALLLGLGLLLMAIGMPVAFAIGIAGFLYFLMPETFLPVNIGPQRIVSATQSFPLLAVHYSSSSAPDECQRHHTTTATSVDAPGRLDERRPGPGQPGAEYADGGVSGSAVADAAMQSRVLGRGMIKDGYTPLRRGCSLHRGTDHCHHSAKHRLDPLRLPRRGIDRPAVHRRHRARRAADDRADDHHWHHGQKARLCSGPRASPTVR